MAAPEARYKTTLNGVIVTIGTFGGVPSLSWEDSTTNHYMATLAGGTLRGSDGDKFAEVLMKDIVLR